jgi:cyclophilin family peptidyl-prolyl cis-trans isomerase
MSFRIFAAFLLTCVLSPANADLAVTVPIGKTVVVPVEGGGTVDSIASYSVASSNRAISARVKTGNPDLALTLSFTGSNGQQQTGQVIHFQLYRDLTPVTATTIAGLAQGGFYNGLKLHRITAEFAQGGDPNGNGSGGPGFEFQNEFALPLIFTGSGQIAMANAGTGVDGGTNGSQFFITFMPVRPFDFRYSLFGQIVRGQDVLEAIRTVERELVDPTLPEGPGNERSKPVHPITITSATVGMNNNDAAVILSATAAGTATVTVQRRDSLGNPLPDLVLNVTSVMDTFNDPPFLSGVQDIVTPLNRAARVPIRIADLEFDYMFPGKEDFDCEAFTDLDGDGSRDAAENFTDVNGNSHYDPGERFIDADRDGKRDPAEPFTDSPGGTPGVFDTKVKLVLAGRLVSVGAAQANYRGPARFALKVEQLPGGNTDFGIVRVGFGDSKLTQRPRTIIARPDAPLQGAVGSFMDADLRSAAASFSATIIWGDGTPVTSGTNVTITKDATPRTTNRFSVSAPHTYTAPGIYPLVVRVEDVNGARTSITSQVIVGPGPIDAVGLVINNAGGLVREIAVASFTDATPTGTGGYVALIDWGDGVKTFGRIRSIRPGVFKVFGTHRYRDAEVFPTMVRISRISTPAEQSTDTALAWGLARVRGVRTPRHLPPYPMVHLVGGLNSASRDGDRIRLEFVIINSGNLPARNASLQFYASADGDLDPAEDDLLLTSSGASSFRIPVVPQNGAGFTFRLTNGNGLDNRLKAPLPDNLTTKRYIIVKMNFPDPTGVGNGMPFERTFFGGPMP